jgi:hypothetical protein
MHSNAEILALFLWFGGLTIYVWKPQTDRRHFVWQAAGVTVWAGLALAFPHLRTWQYAVGNSVFVFLFLFRLAQHRADVGSS